MRSLKLCVMLLLTLCFVYAPNFCSAGLMDNPRVAVFPIASQIANKSIVVDEGAYTEIRTMVDYDLRSFSSFDMLERPDIDKVLTEQEFSHTVVVDPSTAAKLGKILGAEYIVLGAVTGLARVDGEYAGRVTLRMVEVETARIVLTGMGNSKSKTINESLTGATEDALHGKRGMISMLEGKLPKVKRKR